MRSFCLLPIFVSCLYDPRLYRLFQKLKNSSSSLAIANYQMAHKIVDAGASSSSSHGMFHEHICEDMETGMFSSGVEKKGQLQDETANLSNLSDPLLSRSCPMNNKSGLHIYQSSNGSSIDGTKRARTEVGVPRNLTPSTAYATLLQDPKSVAEAKLQIMKQTFQQQGMHTSLNGEVVDHSNQQALLIWAGLLIDAIPESFVIGFMVAKNDTSPLTFIVGVFLSNFPEAMSSSGGISSQTLKPCFRCP